MTSWLKQSTAVDVMLGPFLDSTDGNTIEGALTITQPDIRLSKNGGAFAQKSAAQTLTHGENGWFPANLSTTDTNTLGSLIVAVHESGALPVWREFMVVPANVWDSFFSTDFLQVDVVSLANGVITEPVIATSGVTKIRSLTFGTADSGSTTTVVDASRTESITDYWKGCLILFTNGSITGQCRLITGFNPATDTITFAPATTGAVSTHDYEILPAARVDLHSWLGSVANTLVSGRVDASVGAMAADTLTAAATAVDFLAEVNAEVDTALADYDAPTFAELDARTDAIEADTQDIQVRLPAALVSGRIKAIVEAFAANVIDAAAMNADMNSYTTRTWLAKESTTADKYIVQWAKNGQILTSGITLPKIRVFDESGADLIAETAMTEIGSTQSFKFEELTNKLTPGEIYMVEAKATIDSSVRLDRQPVMRDSA